MSGAAGTVLVMVMDATRGSLSDIDTSTRISVRGVEGRSPGSRDGAGRGRGGDDRRLVGPGKGPALGVWTWHASLLADVECLRGK